MLWGFFVPSLSYLLKSSLPYVAFFKYFTPLPFFHGDEEIKTLSPYTHSCVSCDHPMFQDSDKI